MKKKKLSAAVRAKISAAVKKAAKQRKRNKEIERLQLSALGKHDDHADSVPINQPDFNKTKLLRVETALKQVNQPENAGQQVDMVNHPPHYNSHPSGVEAITVTEWFSFSLGNCIKYVWRAGHKSESQIEDLKKARWYLDREIKRLESSHQS